MEAQPNPQPKSSTASPWTIHWIMLALIAATTLVAASHPAWLLQNPLRCGMQLLFHMNCPFCGMTRDFAAMAQGHAPTHNPGSLLAAICIYIGYPVLLGAASLKRRPELFHHPILRGATFSAIALLWIANNLHR